MRNYLIEGVSGTGKTSVCKELRQNHIWHVDKVRALVANHDEAVTFFCGASRNFSRFIGLFDGVFVLEVDLDTLQRRLDERGDDEWGGKPTERELVVRLHRTKEDTPTNGIVIDATAPIAYVVDEIVRQSAPPRRGSASGAAAG